MVLGCINRFSNLAATARHSSDPSQLSSATMQDDSSGFAG